MAGQLAASPPAADRRISRCRGRCF